MHNAEYWINKLELSPHPEGGFYKEVYRAEESISNSALPSRYSGDRSHATTIYFLLRSCDISRLHRLKSDEIWYFHQGSPLELSIIYPDGQLETIPMSTDDNLQAVIPNNTWFGAKVLEEDSYSLISCSVHPGFDFNDFELANKEELLAEYPQHKELIEELG